MSFSSTSLVPWPVPPDWQNGVRETLAWLTDILQASRSAVTQHRGLRIAPRRSFEFDVVANGQARKVADALLNANGGATWALPIWPDVQFLQEPVVSGSIFIPCRTAGYDFRAGGMAMLWSDLRDWELVTVQDIYGDGLVLANGLIRGWEQSTRLYPARLAHTASDAEAQVWTDDAGKQSLRFDVIEPCDWPAILPEVTYLGHPVLEQRSDMGEDGTASYERLAEIVDNETGIPFHIDQSGTALRNTSHRWVLSGRPEQAAFRSLLYGLQGRAVPIWIPSGINDLRVITPISSAGAGLTVEWAGYSQFSAHQPNRRDICIELNDGTRFYRRIIASAEASGSEVLLLDSPIGQDVSLAAIRAVSYLSLCTQSGDTTEIEHITDADGVARSSTPFKAVVTDV